MINQYAGNNELRNGAQDKEGKRADRLMYHPVTFFPGKELPDKGSCNGSCEYPHRTEIHSGKHSKHATPYPFFTASEFTGTPFGKQVVQALYRNDQYSPFNKEMNGEIRYGAVLKYRNPQVAEQDARQFGERTSNQSYN